MTMRIVVVTMMAGLLLGGVCMRGYAEEKAGVESPEAFEARTKWWRDARFGLFIHWDMSSIAGTEISWSRGATKPLDISGHPAGYVEDPMYDHLYKEFNPVDFDAAAWVRMAQDAGMKYIVFTAKHHGGFCMWDTKLTDYSIMHTPFKRDVVRELADACRRAKMPFGLYYSQRDWYHRDYGIGDNAKYHAFLLGQLTELLTNYGRIDVMWFDSFGHGDSIKYWKADEVVALVRRLQPQIVINNRAGSFTAHNIEAIRGDFDTPEEQLGSFQNTRLWESCMCMITAPGGGWSYRKDGVVKPFHDCLKMLVSCATGDGNLLLDVGPDARGVIPDDQVAVLREFGAWTKRFGESIYRTRGGPWRNGPWGGSTHRGNIVYLHVFRWEGDRLMLRPLRETIRKAEVLTGGRVAFAQTDTEVTFTLAREQQDPMVTVIKLTLDRPVGEIHTEPAPVVRVEIGPDGTVVLPPAAAKTEGGVQAEHRGGQMNLGYWTNPRGSATWTFDLAGPGRFAVTALAATPHEGIRFQVDVGGQTLVGEAKKTGSHDAYAPVALGTIGFPAAGPATLRVSAADPDRWQPVNLRAITLTPVTP
jgi:alpha-L-fucosidase